MFGRWSKLLGSICVLLWAAGPTSAAVTYRVTDLGKLPKVNVSYASAVNSSGQAVGVASAYDHDDYAGSALVFDGSGVARTIGTLGGTCSWAHDINDRGQIVGGAATATSWGHAFVYSGNGPLRDIGTLGGLASDACSINNNGTVVGWSWTTGNTTQRAFVYSGDGPMREIAMPGGYGYTNSYANAINDSGMIAITVNRGSGGNNYAWVCGSDGQLQPIGSLPGFVSTTPTAINNSGTVAGTAWNSSWYSHAFLYSTSGSIQDLGTLVGGLNSSANAMNDAGRVVGRATDSGNHKRAFLYDGGPLIDLNTLIDPTSGWFLEEACDINSAGQIVGLGYTAGGGERAFLLTPTPEPSTLVLLGVGAVGLFGYWWRRRKVREGGKRGRGKRGQKGSGVFSPMSGREPSHVLSRSCSIASRRCVIVTRTPAGLCLAPLSCQSVSQSLLQPPSQRPLG